MSKILCSIGKKVHDHDGNCPVNQIHRKTIKVHDEKI